MSAIPASPLHWPKGWKRTPVSERKSARFGKKEIEHRDWTDGSGATRTSSVLRSKDVSIAEGVARVRAELRRMARTDDVVISTNLELRLDGLPRSGQREPHDSGAAVYWRDSRIEGWPMRCMAIDRYERVADNLAAIAATLEAMRAIERHGGAEILDRAFTGFTALTGPDPERPWHVVLGCPAHASTDHVRSNYRKARSAFHPDRGGDADTFSNIQKAWKAFCAERGLDE